MPRSKAVRASPAPKVPALVCVFTAVEKTKQSYYDIRFQAKYDLRVPILELCPRGGGRAAKAMGSLLPFQDS